MLVAFQSPSTSLYQTNAPGSAASETYFFSPTTVSISISQLQDSATLLVQPINYDATSGNPIVNVSVVAQDIVTFPIPYRGYYLVSFVYGNGSSPAVSYVLDESGLPYDILISGVALMAVAGTIYPMVVLKERRDSLEKLLSSAI